MFRLSKLTDYAVVVLGELARRPADAVAAKADIARRTGVPEPTVAKLLKSLARAGLVVSRRGAAGGYVLARPAGEITVAAIITALDGPIALTACVDGSHAHCGVETLCPMRGNWDKVNRAIRSALDELTLADMTAPLPFALPQAALQPTHA